MAVHFLPFARRIFVKLGARGVLVLLRLNDAEAERDGWSDCRTDLQRRLVCARGNGEQLIIKHFPPEQFPVGATVNVTGAGDTLAGALLVCLLHAKDRLTPKVLDNMVSCAQQGAVLTLQSQRAVSQDLGQLANLLRPPL